MAADTATRRRVLRLTASGAAGAAGAVLAKGLQANGAEAQAGQQLEGSWLLDITVASTGAKRTTLLTFNLDGSVVTTTVTGMVSFVFDPAGALYVLKAAGLYAVSTGGAETLLMPVGSGVVYGSTAPTLGTGDGAMAMLGAKQILIVSGRSLNVVSLP